MDIFVFKQIYSLVNLNFIAQFITIILTCNLNLINYRQQTKTTTIKYYIISITRTKYLMVCLYFIFKALKNNLNFRNAKAK